MALFLTEEEENNMMEECVKYIYILHMKPHEVLHPGALSIYYAT